MMLHNGTTASDAALQRALDKKTCDFCGNTFNRREHLIRHRRTHTKEKPFSCNICQARFLRPDVRDKHEKRCYEVNVEKPLNQGNDEVISVRHNTRSRLACDSCRRKKLKCDNTTPCRTCVARNIKCTTSTASRRPGRPRHDESASPGLNEVVQPDGNQNIPAEQPIPDITVDSIEPNVDEHAYGQNPFDVPHALYPQDFTLQPDPLPEFDDFAMAAQGLDFMNGLWSLPPLTLDSSIDDNSFSLFDDSWLQFSGSILDQPTDRALDMMREHFRLRSRAPSPSRVDTGQQQYSVAPNLARYDPEIINVFLNLARSHLGHWFPIFASFEAMQDCRPELCLSLAAVGALYCSVHGSMKIARSLYHDARRLLMEACFTGQEHLLGLNQDSYLSHAMAFILLELYGLGSGNKRSYEFSEVWHGSLLDFAEGYMASGSADPRRARELQRSVVSIESYRVLILGLPPSMTRITDPHNLSSFNEAMSPSSTNTSESSPDISDLIRIAGVVGCSSKDSAFRLWKPEFIELALDRWLRLQQRPASIPQQLLFHMAHIYLHANIPLMQRYAMAKATSVAKIELPDELQSWTISQDYKISRWHAEKILTLIKRQVNSKSGNHQSQKGPTPAEPPHLSYCLYFATVVIWYGRVSEDQHSQVDTMVHEGIEILSGFKLHVAKLLSLALRELLPNTNNTEE